jgi:hypothetical protein
MQTWKHNDKINNYGSERIEFCKKSFVRIINVRPDRFIGNASYKDASLVD